LGTAGLAGWQQVVFSPTPTLSSLNPIPLSGHCADKWFNFHETRESPGTMLEPAPKQVVDFGHDRLSWRMPAG
jgi:hypothetical protein